MGPAGHAVVHLFSHPVALAPTGTSLLVEGAPRIEDQRKTSIKVHVPGYAWGWGWGSKKKRLIQLKRQM